MMIHIACTTTVSQRNQMTPILRKGFAKYACLWWCIANVKLRTCSMCPENKRSPQFGLPGPPTCVNTLPSNVLYGSPGLQWLAGPGSPVTLYLKIRVRVFSSKKITMDYMCAHSKIRTYVKKRKVWPTEFIVSIWIAIFIAPIPLLW